MIQIEEVLKSKKKHVNKVVISVISKEPKGVLLNTFHSMVSIKSSVKQR